MFWNKKKLTVESVPKPSRRQLNSIADLADVVMNEVLNEVDIAELAQKYSSPVAQPKPAYPDGIAMDAAPAAPDMIISNGYVNPRAMKYYIHSSSYMGYYNMAIIAQHWFIMKGCEWKAREAVKNWFEMSDNGGKAIEPEQQQFIEACNKAYKLRDNIVEAITFNNVFGIRHVLFKHKDPDFDYSLPFNPDAFAGGNYAGMAQIDPYWLNPEIINEDMIDPTRINYYEPEYWTVGGKKYHRSHFVILKGAPVADYLKPTYRYGGISLVQRLYERVYAAESTANEGPQLAKSKRLYARKVNIVESQTKGSTFKKTMNFISRMRDNYGTEIMGKDDEMMKFDTSLTDLGDIIMNQYDLAAAIIGGPKSKILGTGHSGLSTGETDDDYWIQGIEEVQGNEAIQIVEGHLERLIPSEITPKLGITPKLDITWNPLKVSTEKEDAEVRNLNANSLSMLFNDGLITKGNAAQFIAKDKNFNISSDQLESRDEVLSETDDYNSEFEDEYPEGDIQQQALNGAQVTSLVDVAAKVKLGELEREAAIEIITSSFPIDRAQAMRIIPEQGAQPRVRGDGEEEL